MTKSDQERVVVYRRILGEKLLSLNDREVLDILNAAIIPNALSMTAFKYSTLISLTFSKAQTLKSFEKIKRLVDILNPLERSLIKFGVLHGFDSFNGGYQYTRFISLSLDIGKANIGKKKISEAYFEKIFPFIYQLIFRGEKNERFPRV